MNKENSEKRQGRPLSFDPDHVMGKILDTFWKYGYEGTSMSLLTEATGLNKPSLYSAFGDKKNMFRQAISHYKNGPAKSIVDALQEKDIRDVVEQVLMRSISLIAAYGDGRGCIIIQGALTCGPDASVIRDELGLQRQKFLSALTDRLQRAQAEGQLASDAEPPILARFIATLQQGLSVQASSGVAEQDLLPIVRLLVDSLPLTANQA